ncbi:hypothetical protein [Streptomyces sp. NPDC054783]
MPAARTAPREPVRSARHDPVAAATMNSGESAARIAGTPRPSREAGS